MSFSEDIFKEYETFKNKNAIITGATGTIGTEVTKKLLELGVNIVGLIHNISNINPNFQQYIKNGKLKYIQVEFKNGKNITENFKQALLFLKGRLDILICCQLSRKIFRGKCNRYRCGRI